MSSQAMATDEGVPSTAPACLDRSLLFARTVRHLRPSQVLHRARLRLQRAAVATWPGPARRALQIPPSGVVGWPEQWSSLDARDPSGSPDPETNASGVFEFLGEARAIGQPPDWEQASATRLWRFHLHYLDWAWSFANHPDRAWARAAFGELWQSWRTTTPFGGTDGWAPYVAALRAWTLCGVYRQLIHGTPHERLFVEDLSAHAGYLRWHLEHDVGGNHLVKNVKALFGLGVFLRNDRLVDTARRLLRRELSRQILGDGGHFERSPSYHCQVLGDLIDVEGLSTAAGLPPLRGLTAAVAAMRRWLGHMVMPDGDVPFFNDGVPVGSRRLSLLAPAEPPQKRLVALRPSGYVVVHPGDRMHLVIDVGRPCPAELPAHAHACCLSFELAVDGLRVLTNSGTSTYEPGRRRAFERSTRAHNTVVVDNANQTEVWGTFRAARRARPRVQRLADEGSVLEVLASHDGYRRLPGRPVHRRHFRVSAQSLDIVDEVTGDAARVHSVRALFHAAPGVPVTVRGERSADVGPLTATFAGDEGLSLRSWEPGAEPCGWVARGFGRLHPASGIEVFVAGVSPLRFTTQLSCGGDGE